MASPISSLRLSDAIPALVGLATGLTGQLLIGKLGIILGFPTGFVIGAFAVHTWRARQASEPQESAEERLRAMIAGAGPAPEPPSGPAPTSATPAPPAVGATSPPQADLPVLLQAIREKAASAPAEALEEARQLMEQWPAAAGIRALISELHQGLGDGPAALAEARQAIELAVRTAAFPLAVTVVRQLGAARRELELSADTFGQLGRVFLQQAAFADAAWCLDRAARAGLDPTKAARELIAIADAARDAGDLKVAVGTYEYVARRWPELPFVGYAQATAQAVRQRISKAGS